MSKITEFTNNVVEGYKFEADSFYLGGIKLDKTIVENQKALLPLATLNRHGLIAGATGTGKTKTIQVIAEQLSLAGVPTLLMDIKGDMSGISQPGEPNDKVNQRAKELGIEWQPSNLPCEFLSLNDNAVKVRSSITEFGSVLLSKLLELSDVQTSVVALIFKYCSDRNIPLLDLVDFRKTLQYFATEAGKKDLGTEYGIISATTIGSIMRKIVELEEQGVNTLFGEPSFDVNDLVRTDNEGKGYINILRLIDLQSKPQLFTTFMLSLINKIYSKYPELGDMDKPKLCIFIDEAHLIFSTADNTLLQQIETTIKLIRSKGVGIFFITQNPSDIPQGVLSQLGLKIQHSLRAFTALDRKAIKTASENYPISEYYQTDTLLTELGIGEALLTCLNERGNPTPLAHIMITPPTTRMDVISDLELKSILNSSSLYQKYKDETNRESAEEILQAKMEQIEKDKLALEQAKVEAKLEEKETKNPSKIDKTPVEKVANNYYTKVIGSVILREVSKAIMAALGFGKKR